MDAHPRSIAYQDQFGPGYRPSASGRVSPAHHRVPDPGAPRSGDSGGAAGRGHPDHAQQQPSARAYRCRQYRVADGRALPGIARYTGRGASSTSTSNCRCKAAWVRARRMPSLRSSGWSTNSTAGFRPRAPARRCRDRLRCPAFPVRRRSRWGRARERRSFLYPIFRPRRASSRCPRPGFLPRKPSAIGTTCRPHPR